jgi:hypothetical protein
MFPNNPKVAQMDSLSSDWFNFAAGYHLPVLLACLPLAGLGCFNLSLLACNLGFAPLDLGAVLCSKGAAVKASIEPFVFGDGGKRNNYAFHKRKNVYRIFAKVSCSSSVRNARNRCANLLARLKVCLALMLS